MKRIRVPSLLKRIMAALSSKTNEMRTRIMIFFLIRNKTMIMDSLSDKLQALASNPRHRHKKEDDHHDGGGEGEQFVAYCDRNALTAGNAALSTEAEAAAEVATFAFSDDAVAAAADVLEFHQEGEEVADERNYLDLTHTLFKASKEEMKLNEEYNDDDVDTVGSSGSAKASISEEVDAGDDEVEEEEDIDQAADLFIRRFRNQIRLQKQESFGRYMQMMQRGV